MKRLEVDIMSCSACPYCIYKEFDGEWREYCSNLDRYTGEFEIARVTITGKNGEEYTADIIAPPDDCPLPNCEPSGNTG